MRGAGLGRCVLVLACSLAVLAGSQASGEATRRPAAVFASGAVAAPAPVPAAPLRIMPLGASSTVGTGSPATAGYRGPLRELLAEDGIALDLVGSLSRGPASVPDRDHEGRGGWTLARMTPHVAGWVRAARPDIVLLHAGTNDLLQGVSARTAAERLDALLDEIHGVSDAHIVVAGVWAPMPSRAKVRSDFAALSAAVVGRHRAGGHSVSNVDTSVLLGHADLTDRLHANAGGYRRIAAMWRREILAHLGR